jgi:dipeptidyl aminopeptidase/acylaminoacyl peptidase
LKSGVGRTILSAESNAGFIAPGYLLFVSNGRLLAQEFDPEGFEISGDAFPVADDVWTNPATGRAAFAASDRGLLAFRNGANFGTTQFVERDRAGKELRRIGTPGAYGNPAWSPDGKRMAVDLNDLQKGSRSIWTLELKPDGILSRFTLTPTNDFSPLWMPSGKHIIFLSDRAATSDSLNVYRAEFGETGKEDVLLKSADIRDLLAWATAESALVLQTFDAKTRFDLSVLKLSGDSKPVPFMPTEFNEIQASVSPNSQWIAYSSDESGQYEIYVQKLPSGGGKQQLSRSGGLQPQWNPNGKELFYIAADRTLMAVRVNAGSALEVDIPKPLFQSGVYGPSVVRSRNNYLVGPDGETFLLNTIVDSKKPINVITGWTGR